MFSLILNAGTMSESLNTWYSYWCIGSGQCIRSLIQFSYLPKINQTNGLDGVKSVFVTELA